MSAQVTLGCLLLLSNAEYALVVHGYSHYSGGLYTKKNLCLGHFTRIVNINTSGGNSRLKR